MRRNSGAGARIGFALPMILAAAGGLYVAAAPAALAATRFDGNWAVTLVCQATADGAKPYTWQFPAQVRDGGMRGQHGTPGQAYSMTLEGTIRPDGSATMTASGLTGSASTTLGRVSTGTPYSFPVTARFDGASGSGQRVGGRACTFTFSRQ